MKLTQLKEIVDKAVEYAGAAEHSDVIIVVGKRGEYEVLSVY